MKVCEIAKVLGLTMVAGKGDREVTGFYTCDLLSWVISHANAGDMWVTIMNNINILAVASLADVSCIVISEGIEVYESLIERANEKEITILTTGKSAADIVIEAATLLKRDT